MDVLEIIELINGLGGLYYFCVKLVNGVDIIQQEPEDNCLFFDKDELVGFLFDKVELYGWVVTSYNIMDYAYQYPHMSITLYNQDIQRGKTK